MRQGLTIFFILLSLGLVTAVFQPTTRAQSGDLYTLTVSREGNGQVTVAPSLPAYSAGQAVTMTAVPDPGWNFVAWRGNLLPTPHWRYADWRYRAPITVNAGDAPRRDSPVEVEIDFSALFASLGVAQTVDLNSLRLVEVDAAGVLLNENVPFQFDPAPDFDPAGNASGALIFLLPGATAVNAVRTFHLYFDVAGRGFTPAITPPQINVTDDVMDEGQASFRIATPAATYYYQKQGAGFSSLLDVNGNDWISYKPEGGAAGNFRGIPNMFSAHFHPGGLTGVSTLVNQGPLKATIRSVTTDTDWEVMWEIFPRYARMTVLRLDEPYWFLYEGTPGGVLEPDTDFIVRSNGLQTPASVSWAGDLVGEEWLYFADPNVGRALFLAHHTDDDKVDSYWPMEDAMTVFGFGRLNLNKYIEQVPSQFTIGLIDATSYAAAAPLVRGAYRDLEANLGTPEQRGRIVSDGRNPLTLNLFEDVAATAVFEPAAYTLSVATQGNGRVDVTPDQPTYRYGDVVALTAAPEPGWLFGGWSGDVSVDAPRVMITILRDTAVTAAFLEAPEVTLTLNVEGSGAVQRDPDRAPLYGETVLLTASPAPGWLFAGWSGDLLSNANPASVTMTADKTITAAFTPNDGRPRSDGFSSCTLDPARWTFVNPLGDAALRLTGTQAVIDVPGGQSHTLWQEVKTAPRLMTPANNTDLDLQVRFASPLGQRYQAQGILIEQDAANYLRFEFHHDGVSTRVFAAGFINNAPTVYRNLPVSVRDESYLWVGRLGDVWTLAFSDDGSAWTVATSFAQPLRVTAAGVFAGNDAAPGEIPPAHAAVIDYFLNTADALDLEDGVRNTLTMTTAGRGAVTANPPGGDYACGQEVRLTAVPVRGWAFAGWSGDVSGTDNPAALTISGDHAVTATFVMRPPKQFLPLVVNP